MTIDQATSQIPVRLDFDARAPRFASAMGQLDHAATTELDRAEIDSVGSTKAASQPTAATRLRAMHRPGGPSLAKLAEFGLARISFGGTLHAAVAERVRELAAQLAAKQAALGS
jgi:hypothetical protein